MELSVVARRFVEECKAAGMTPDLEWTLPADTSELQRIAQDYDTLITMVASSVSAKPPLALKPLIWLVFRRCLTIVPIAH